MKNFILLTIAFALLLFRILPELIYNRFHYGQAIITLHPELLTYHLWIISILSIIVLTMTYTRFKSKVIYGVVLLFLAFHEYIWLDNFSRYNFSILLSIWVTSLIAKTALGISYSKKTEPI